MTIYEESEYNLAALLGWQRLSLSGGTVVGYPPDGNESHRFQAAVPRWTRDDAEAFKLMVEYSVELLYNSQSLSYAFIVKSDRDYGSIAIYGEHACKLDAIRYAIVSVVIKLLSDK